VPTQIRSYECQFAEAKELAATIQSFSTKEVGKIFADARTNNVVLQDTPGKLGELIKLLEQLDQPTKQVYIKSAIAEVSITNDQNERLGKPPLTAEEEKLIRDPIVDAAEKEGNAYYATARIWDDGIIDPAKTRDVLGLSISAALNGPLRDDEYGYGVFRM
jgi:hypothetical protein